MNRIKSIFISLFMTSLMAGTAIAVWQLSTSGWKGAWWGVVLASTAPMAFFARLFLAPVARTSVNVWWMPAAGVAGAVLAAYAGGPGLAFALALVMGVALPMMYIHWYSRFESRSTDLLTPGRRLPEFALETLEGKTVRSSELVGKSALWMFYRGNWCPLCMAQIREVAAQYRVLAERGVEVLLVSPQPQDHSLELARRFDAPMRFLVDVDNSAASTLGILAEDGLPLGMQALGYDSDVPMPTVLITAPGGKIVYSDLTDNYRIRPEPAEFIAALDRAGL